MAMNSFFWVGSLLFWGLINGWTNSYANGGPKNIYIDSKQNVGKLLLGQVMLFAVLPRHYGFHVYNVESVGDGSTFYFLFLKI